MQGENMKSLFFVVVSLVLIIMMQQSIGNANIINRSHIRVPGV